MRMGAPAWLVPPTTPACALLTTQVHGAKVLPSHCGMCPDRYHLAPLFCPTGDFCEQPPDFCSAELSPCQHGSTCIPTSQGPR